MITPNEARDRANCLSAGAISQIEDRIDAAIAIACESQSWPVTIAVSCVRCSRDAWRDACIKYQSSGWRISIIADQRDGDFVQIERP